jgi:hypothetical protein
MAAHVLFAGQTATAACLLVLPAGVLYYSAAGQCVTVATTRCLHFNVFDGMWLILLQ